jgi:hypothetical protein
MPRRLCASSPVWWIESDCLPDLHPCKAPPSQTKRHRRRGRTVSPIYPNISEASRNHRVRRSAISINATIDAVFRIRFQRKSVLFLGGAPPSDTFSRCNTLFEHSLPFVQQNASIPVLGTIKHVGYLPFQSVHITKGWALSSGANDVFQNTTNYG